MSDYYSKHHQELQEFVNREVVYCVSSLVSELIKNAEHFRDYYDDLMNLCYGQPDYEELAKWEEWKQSPEGVFYQEKGNQFYLSVNLNERGLIYVSVHELTYPGQEDGKEVWKFSGSWDEAAEYDGSDKFDPTDPDMVQECLINLGIIPDGSNVYDDSEGDFYVCDHADSWQELCEMENIDTDSDRPEVYEHWIVTDWLARKLAEHGETVCMDLMGLTVWGRCCTGQGIALDGVISEIHRELYANHTP